MPSPSSSPSIDFDAAFTRLTPRDHTLLRWLAEHYALTTEQISAALFPSYRAATQRLSILAKLGAVTHYAYPRLGAGAGMYRYTLGEVGLLLHPGRFHHPDHAEAAPPRNLHERRARIATSARSVSGHLFGANQFFIDLHARARQDPQYALVRWWSEQHATKAFKAYPGGGVRPDGHGVWAYRDRTVGFFLEHDTGTEDLNRLLSKVIGYARLAAEGPSFPVLLHLPGTQREKHVLAALGRIRPPIPVATAVHGHNPADAIWALPGVRGRLRLHELPCDHGPDSPMNPARYGAHPDDLPTPTIERRAHR